MLPRELLTPKETKDVFRPPLTPIETMENTLFKSIKNCKTLLSHLREQEFIATILARHQITNSKIYKLILLKGIPDETSYSTHTLYVYPVRSENQWKYILPFEGTRRHHVLPSEDLLALNKDITQPGTMQRIQSIHTELKKVRKLLKPFMKSKETTPEIPTQCLMHLTISKKTLDEISWSKNISIRSMRDAKDKEIFFKHAKNHIFYIHALLAQHIFQILFTPLADTFIMQLLLMCDTPRFLQELPSSFVMFCCSLYKALPGEHETALLENIQHTLSGVLLAAPLLDFQKLYNHLLPPLTLYIESSQVLSDRITHLDADDTTMLFRLANGNTVNMNQCKIADFYFRKLIEALTLALESAHIKKIPGIKLPYIRPTSACTTLISQPYYESIVETLMNSNLEIFKPREKTPALR